MRVVVGLALASALVAGAVLWTRVSSRGRVSAIESAPTASDPRVAEPHAPPSFVGATPSPAEDEASRDVAFAITSSAPDANVIFRGSTYALPYAASVARGSAPETVVVSAPRHQGSRIQMRFDRPVSLRVNLPTGAGTKDATTAEIESFSAAAPSLPATANAVNMPRGPLRPAATDTHEALPDAPTTPANAASRPAPVTAASRPALVTAEPVPPPPPPATTPPVVAAPAPTVGTIDSRAVNATVRSHGAEIRDCFDRAKLRNAEVRGRVTVGATISGTGAVQAAAVTLSSANDPRLESCVVGAFRSWSFPPPSGALPAPLTYTFTFE